MNADGHVIRAGGIAATQDGELKVSLEITNTGNEMLPASIGGHPAFNWSLQNPRQSPGSPTA